MATNFDTTVTGTGGNDDLRVQTSQLDQLIRGGAGNDTLRGGKGDDRLYGGQGNDIMSGGGGADQFYFKGSDVVSGTTDTDRIVDLNFGAGDSIVLDNFGASFFGSSVKGDGYNVFDNGNDVIISSYEGLRHLVNDTGGTITASGSASLNLLVLTIDYGNDQTQVLRLSNAYNGFYGEPA